MKHVKPVTSVKLAQNLFTGCETKMIEMLTGLLWLQIISNCDKLSGMLKDSLDMFSKNEPA